MCNRDEIDLFDHDQKQRLMHEARMLRADALRMFLGRLRGSFSAAGRWSAGVIRNRWDSYAKRREYRAAVRELGALDDRSLKDIGLHRSEIESVVYGADLRQEGKVAAILFHKPPHKRNVGKPSPRRHPIERDAA